MRTIEVQPLVKPRIIVSLFDLHWPEIDWPTVRCMWQVMEDYRPQLAGFVFGGDDRDNKMISPHTEDDVEAQSKSYFDDLDEYNDHILKPTEKLIPHAAHRVRVLGNHCDWERQYALAHPNMKGMESHLRLGMARRGWKVIPCGRMWTYGKLSYMHGEWLGGKHHCARAVDTVCGNVVYGHFHTMQSHTKVTSYNKKNKWLAQSMPIGGKVDPEWVRGAPNGWINGFGVTEFQPNGNYNHYPIVVSDGMCSFGGRIYKG